MKSILLAAAMVAVFTGLAHAETGKVHGHSPHTREGYVERFRSIEIEAMFNRFDIDDDGVITKREATLALLKDGKRDRADRHGKIHVGENRVEVPHRKDRAEQTAPQQRRTDCISRNRK